MDEILARMGVDAGISLFEGRFYTTDKRGSSFDSVLGALSVLIFYLDQ